MSDIGVVRGGLAWMVPSQVGATALRFVGLLVLARLVSPAEFGQVQMVAIVAGFAALLSDLGLAAAVTGGPSRFDDDTPSTALAAATAGGALLASVTWLAAPLLASFYGEPAVAGIARLYSLDFLLRAVGVVPRAVLLRDHRFPTVAIVDVVAALVGVGLAVWLAVDGLGARSLVVVHLGSSAPAGVALLTLTRRSFSARPSRTAWRRLRGFARDVTLFQVANYWARQADDLLIGRFLGAVPLGLYSRAYSLMLVPVRQASVAVGQVVYPVLSSMAADPIRLGRGWLRVTRGLGAVTLPLSIGVTVFAEEVVLLLLGPDWSEAAPLLRVLGPLAALQSVGATSGWLYQSSDNTATLRRWGLGSSAVTVLAFVIGLPWGAIGVATAYLVRGVVLGAVNLWLAARTIGLAPGEVGRSLSPLAPAATAMTLCAVLGSWYVSWGTVLVVSGAVYVAVLAATAKPVLEDVRSVLGRQAGQPPGSARGAR